MPLRHEVFDDALRVAVENRAEVGCEVVDRVNAGNLAGGDVRAEHDPVLGADPAAREKRVFQRQRAG